MPVSEDYYRNLIGAVRTATRSKQDSLVWHRPYIWVDGLDQEKYLRIVRLAVEVVCDQFEALSTADDTCSLGPVYFVYAVCDKAYESTIRQIAENHSILLEVPMWNGAFYEIDEFSKDAVKRGNKLGRRALREVLGLSVRGYGHTR